MQLISPMHERQNLGPALVNSKESKYDEPSPCRCSRAEVIGTAFLVFVGVGRAGHRILT